MLLLARGRFCKLSKMFFDSDSLLLHTVIVHEKPFCLFTMGVSRQV